MSLPSSLIERFVHYLGDVHAEVVQLDVRLQASGTDPADILEDLRAIAHKLAGTAGAFGFDALGEHARNLELAVQRRGDDPSAARDDVRSLREALEEAAASRPV